MKVPLQRAAGHIKGRCPPCWFQLPPWESVNKPMNFNCAIMVTWFINYSRLSYLKVTSTSAHSDSCCNGSIVLSKFHSTPTAAIAYSRALYGQGSGSILLDDVRCTGTESRLIDCSYDSHTADCSHSEDAAVYCSTCELSPTCYVCSDLSEHNLLSCHTLLSRFVPI